jgi:tripartite-type tricarboxylate transporter receptor subunit TctC
MAQRLLRFPHIGGELKMRRLMMIALLVMAVVTPVAADYPDRTIHLLVPYPPGGPNDTIARMIGSKLADSLGQQVVIENRAGAAGNLAMELTARAAPDGHTAVVPSVSYVTNPALFKKINYKLEDVTPVSLIAKGPTLLVASPSLGVKSVAELIALAKQKPGKIDYGSGGIGSTSHLSGELLRFMGGIEIQHIPYKGTNDLISDLLAGRVPLYFMSPLVARQYILEGKLVALGMTSAKRVQGWLDTPTMAETLPGFVVETWHPLVVPTATPEAVIDKLSKHVADAVRSKEVTDRLLTLGFEPVGSTPGEARTYIAAETQRWLDIIKKANVQVD